MYERNHVPAGTADEAKACIKGLSEQLCVLDMLEHVGSTLQTRNMLVWSGLSGIGLAECGLRQGFLRCYRASRVTGALYFCPSSPSLR